MPTRVGADDSYAEVAEWAPRAPFHALNNTVRLLVSGRRDLVRRTAALKGHMP
ncbi:MAG: hypothetical protein ACR2P0_10890 [Acidimicrobiales bacterium]